MVKEDVIDPELGVLGSVLYTQIIANIHSLWSSFV